MPAEKYSRYEIGRELGQGGMATVYRAYDPTFEREVAVKILKKDLLEDPQLKERFERETKIIARLEHAAIVPVYDVGFDNGQLFYVMRYMAGGSLSERIEKGLTPNEIAHILIRISAALDYAHGKGIVHRDLKPGNILFDENNNPYISDFGIAKFTQASTRITHSGIIGTPRYMSPEQARGDEADGRSDIYSLGIMLFEMLSGHTPFEATTPLAMAFKHAVEAPPSILLANPNLPEGIDAVITKALAKQPSERYKTAAEFVNAFLENFPNEALTDASLYTLPPPSNYKPKIATELPRISTREPINGTRVWQVSVFILIILFIAFDLWTFSRLNTTSIPTVISTTNTKELPTSTSTPSETPAPSATFTPAITQTSTPFLITETPKSTPTTPTISINGNYYLVFIPILLLALGIYTYKANIFYSIYTKPRKSEPKESVIHQLSTSSLTINALADIDDRTKRKELLLLIGRDQELRLKDRIAYFGGGKYLLHGFGRFGASALIDQIVKLAQIETSQIKKESTGIIMTVRLDASTFEEYEGGINALIREFKYEAKHGNYSRSVRTQIERLEKKRLADVSNSTNENTISVKAAPLPGIEAQFSRKFGNNGSNKNVSGEEILKFIADFLDHAEQPNSISFSSLIDKILGNTTIPARVIFVIDKIKSENVFSLLRRMNLLNDDRISIFAIVKQENYLSWKKSPEKLNIIHDLGFQSHYVPCLWEEQSNFVERWINEAFISKIVDEDKNILDDFKNHITFISRGAPGDVVKASLSNIYCEYPFGIPKLNLRKIRNLGEIKTNAKLQSVLNKNWVFILGARFEDTKEEERDQARRAVYTIIDWINTKLIFTLNDIREYALNTELRISNSDPIVINILDTLLRVLVDDKYLIRKYGKYGVAHRIELKDLQNRKKSQVH